MTVCTVLAFAQPLEEVTWNGFPTILKEFPEVLSTCWLLFLHSLAQLIQKKSQLDLNWVIVEARSSDAALHHSLSITNSSYIT